MRTPIPAVPALQSTALANAVSAEPDEEALETPHAIRLKGLWIDDGTGAISDYASLPDVLAALDCCRSWR